MSDELAFKEPVRLATTANITLSGEQTIDGSLTSEDRVLVKDQSASSENGIYVSSSGPWERALDFDGPLDFVNGTMVRANEGAVNGGTVWACAVTGDLPEIDVSDITFAVFNPSASVSGDLSAIEALSGTGIARRTGSETWALGDPVTNGELDEIAEGAIKGRASAGTGEVEDLSTAQVTAMLDVFAGDAGGGGAQGLVPAPATGDGDKFLRGNGEWDNITLSGVINSQLANMPQGTIKGRNDAGSGVPEDLTAAEVTALLDEMEGASADAAGTKGLAPAPAAGDEGKFLRGDGAWERPLESIIIAVTDETTAVTQGTNKVTFLMPYDFTVTAVKASLTTAQASGAALAIDINKAGTSILDVPLDFVNTETLAVGAISSGAIAENAAITIDVDTVGNGSAKGLKVYIVGRQS